MRCIFLCAVCYSSSCCAPIESCHSVVIFPFLSFHFPSFPCLPLSSLAFPCLPFPRLPFLSLASPSLVLCCLALAWLAGCCPCSVPSLYTGYIHGIQPDYVFTVNVAMLEIYNEDVRDLLSESSPSAPPPPSGGAAGDVGGGAGGGGEREWGSGALNAAKLEIRRDQDGRVQVHHDARDMYTLWRLLPSKVEVAKA